MMGITGAFSSLGINERPENTPETKKIPKNSSTISLPNLVLTDRPPNFIRNVCDDEIEATEQPVDFSKKYCETKVIKNSTFTSVVKNYNSSFTMYAETDLDQPTDYSLRYAEDDSDSDQCNKLPKTEATEFVQDTIKTYCTEDTPYETPFNFSTSTSMSDLRIDDKASKLDTDTKDTDVTVINTNRNKIKSEFSSGLMSPEKPVNYCEEGTPGYFSRVASCGSLNSLSVNDPPKQESKDESPEGHKKELRRVSKFPSEAKAVKFEDVVNYAEETPLMFSRSSSLASLDSIEQHSIHDDRSSVVSDFSRLTSGVISPSELPDSPSQTVPPSPKPRKNPIVFPPILKKKTEEVTQTVETAVPKSSVFEDVVKKFKTESTPLEFSTATSLSSLLDDEIDSKVPTDEVKNEIAELSEDSEDEDILAACINIGMQSNRYSQPTSNSPPASEVPSSSYKFSQHSDIVRLTPKGSPQHLSITVEAKQFDPPVQKSDITSDSLRTYCTEDTPAVLSHAGSNSDLSVLSMPDSEKRDLNLDERCKPEIVRSDQEEAPVAVVRESGDLNTSRAIETNCSNHSRRSSFSSLSDDSHESEQALLQECILAGMPKSNSAAIITGSSTLTDVKKEDETVENEVSDDDDDVNILADCMSRGMKINRYSRVNSQEPEDNQLHSLSQPAEISPPEDEEDANILAECINKGMQSNRYTRPTPTNFQNLPSSRPPPNNDVVSDNVKSYCTEDTPAILSHAGSCSNLSVLSMQDVNSTCSDEEDERLLEECVRYGMPPITGKITLGDSDAAKEDRKKEDDASSLSSSYSDDSFESEQALLQQCIQAGMPKPTRTYQDDSNELTPAEKALLQQCILEGMKKCCQFPKKPPETQSAIFPKTKTSLRPPEEDSSELTEAEQALLRQCILSGMPKNKNLTQGGPSGSRESTELTEAERLLLQQCILAGMPKSRNKLIGVSSRENVGGVVGRQWWRRPKEGEKNGPEHTCCIHCPRNSANRGPVKQNGHVKTRRRYRERDVQVRETRDVNILYVTSRILTMKKEIVDRSHEKWV